MPAEDPSSRRWFLRYKAEAVFLGLLAAAVIGGAFYIRHAEYVGGTENLGFKGFVAFMQIYGVLALTNLGYILWTIIQLFRALYTGRRALPYVAFLIAPPIILVAGWMITVPLSRPFLRGFERWVLREVDIDAIQQWVATEGHKYSFMGGSTELALGGQVPDSFAPFRDKHIWFPDPASEGGVRVNLRMGNTARDWGLVAGLPDMPMPKEGLSEGVFRRPIKPGVYIYCE